MQYHEQNHGMMARGKKRHRSSIKQEEPSSPVSSDSESSVNNLDDNPRPSKVTNKNHSIFLESTYQMISAANPAVATWSPSGDTFIIKNPTEFAADVIPRYFKHSKFSSFVRQLNFYGFRKLKVDDPNLPPEEKTWWEFQHEKFLRGHKHLLTDIRRKTCTGADGINQMSREMKDTKREVDGLREDFREMKNTIDRLTMVIEELTRTKEQEGRQSTRSSECPALPQRTVSQQYPSPSRPRLNLEPNVEQTAPWDELPSLTPMDGFHQFQNEDWASVFSTTPRQAIEGH